MIILAVFLLLGLTLLLFIASQVVKKMHWTAKVLLFPWEIMGLLLDILILQGVIATIIFMEWPIKEWTFSGRINRLEHSGAGYRKRLAAWLCEHFLRPIDPSHC